MLNAVDPLQGLSDYTPVWQGITMGASTSTGWYVRLAQNWIVFEATLTLGSGFSWTGAPQVSLPVPAANPILPQPFQFRVVMSVASLTYMGAGVLVSPNNTDSPYLGVYRVNATYADIIYPTNAIPGAWAAGDKFYVHGRYVPEKVV